MNPQMLLPHALNGLRHRLLHLARSSHQFQPGEPLPTGEPGLRQQGARLFRIEFHAVRSPVPRAVWREAEAWLPSSAHHIAHQRLPVHGHGKGLPHADVLQRPAPGIQPVKNSHVIIVLAEVRAAALPGVRRHLRRHVVGHVHLAVEKHAGFRKSVHGGKKADSVQADRRGIPVPGIPPHLHIVIETVLRHHKRTVAHGRSGPGPCPRPAQHASMGLHCMAGDRKPGAVQKQQGKLGHRGAHRQLQSMVVHGARAHIRGIPQIRASGADVFQHDGRHPFCGTRRHSGGPFHQGRLPGQFFQFRGIHAVQLLPVHAVHQGRIQPVFRGKCGAGTA